MAAAIVHLERLPDTPEHAEIRENIRSHLTTVMTQTIQLVTQAQASRYDEATLP